MNKMEIPTLQRDSYALYIFFIPLAAGSE